MKKIGALTFHASYNHGSALQAYALQKYVQNLNSDIDYSIINLRTDVQKQLYDYKLQKNIIKKIIRILLIGDLLKKRERNFESFMKQNMNLTKEYSAAEELKENELNFDYYITGSDQIWNLCAKDFSWAYFLDFVNKGKKISYAASAGPIQRKFEVEKLEKIKGLIKKYDLLSVREQGTFEFIKEYSGLEAQINIDPTLLLTKKDWEELINNEKRIIEEPRYITYSSNV